MKTKANLHLNVLDMDIHMSAKIGLNYIRNNNSKKCFLILYTQDIHSGKIIHLFYIAVNNIAPVNKNNV